jgi:carboxyl-terminal processing protease
LALETHVRDLRLHRLLISLLLVATLLVAAPARGGEPAAGTVEAPRESRHALRLRTAGLDQAVEGQFESALQTLRQALREAPEDPVAAEAVGLIEDYLQARDEFHAERQLEYQQAVDRIHRSMLVREYFAAQEDPDRVERIQDGLEEMMYRFAGTVEPDWPADFPENLKVLDEDYILEITGKELPDLQPEDYPLLNEALDDLEGAEESEDAEKTDSRLRADYDGTAHAEDLREAETPDQARALQERSIAAIEGTREALDAAAAILGEEDSEYARTFRGLAGHCRLALEAYQQAWQEVDPADEDTREAGADRLSAHQYEVVDAVNDVYWMGARKSWRVMLVQARQAQEISGDPKAVIAEPWYEPMVEIVLAEAQTAREDDEWYEVLHAYVGLSELEPGNEEYDRQLGIARQHVRVSGLYGEDPEKARPDETSWRELTEGIDLDMLRKAIQQVDEFYVETVDYRKITTSALESLRVLAESEAARRSFPALADEARRQAFLEAVDNQLFNLEQRDRADRASLLLALIGTILSSEDTVEIPLEVLVMEYGDAFLDELDKFSSMVWPYTVTEFEKQIRGSFTGVGIQITKKEGQPLRVASPLPDSPAWRAGIRTGDWIVAVDGKRTEGLNINKLVRMIMGPKGTTVTLRVRRPGEGKGRDVEVTRDEILIRTVKGWRRQSGEAGGGWDYFLDESEKIAYIRITQFYEDTHTHLREVLRALRERGVEGVILDLRFNPGGLLDSAQEVSDEFLDAGMIVSTKGRQKAERRYKATSRGAYLNGELVVLINSGSASASEIVSGALKDWNRAIIVGDRSYGKGSVQNVIAIPRHRAMLRLTTGYYYLPSGRCLHRRNGDTEWGVDPHVRVHITPRQQESWLQIRRRANLLKESEPAELAEQLQEEYQADLQLQTAALLLKLRNLRNQPPLNEQTVRAEPVEAAPAGL